MPFPVRLLTVASHWCPWAAHFHTNFVPLPYVTVAGSNIAWTASSGGVCDKGGCLGTVFVPPRPVKNPYFDSIELPVLFCVKGNCGLAVPCSFEDCCHFMGDGRARGVLPHWP